ncbi:hypothetical protein CPB97_010807 [Podila verticillata]|nr:hypothetical protein CPB97_010807 [Podila verticillata]
MPPKIAPMDIPHIQELVCRSLSSRDIYQGTLVCRNWHRNLSRFLWRSISLSKKAALRRFLASPQAQHATELSYLIENLTSPFPEIFSCFLSTIVIHNTEYQRYNGEDSSDHVVHLEQQEDHSVFEDLHHLFSETLAPPRSLQVSTKVTCQFSQLTELRSTCITARDVPINHFQKRRQALPTLFQIIQQAPLLKVLELGSLPVDPATITWTMPILWRHPSLQELKLWSRGVIRVSEVRAILWYSTGLKKLTWLQDPRYPGNIDLDCDLVAEDRIQELQSLFPGYHPNSVETFHYFEPPTVAATASYRLEELDLRTAPIPHDLARTLFLPFLRGYCPNLKRLVYPWIPSSDDPDPEFDHYLPGVPMVINYGMPHLRHLDLRNVNHTVDEMMETILESCSQLETFYAPGGETSFGDLACNALLADHALSLREVSFAKCGIASYNMIRVLRNCPNLQRFRALMMDVEQDNENSGYFFVGDSAVDPIFSFKPAMGALHPEEIYWPWACKGLKTLSLRFKKPVGQTSANLVPLSLLARIGVLGELEELFLEQADPENEDEGEDENDEEKVKDPLEKVMIQEGVHYFFFTGFQLLMGLKRLKRFVLINMDLALVEPACLKLEALLPGLGEPIRVWEKSFI